MVLLKQIEDFECAYDLHSPIWWYTKEPFIYLTVNQALRTQNINVIIKMGFVIRDIHREIEQIHAEPGKNGDYRTVYRGQGMSSNEFKKVKNSQDSLLSFNNYLSTSTDRQVAFMFAESIGDNPALIGVLFHIDIDPSISSAMFISLNNITHHLDEEQEILFLMHTVFRIDESIQIAERFY
jgi:hypothetical protein